MTIITTLVWTRYDGSPKTLPEEDTAVLVLAKSNGGKVHRSSCELVENENFGAPAWDDEHGASFPITVGDLWTPWPTILEL